MKKASIAALLFVFAHLSHAQEITNSSFANWNVNGINQFLNVEY